MKNLQCISSNVEKFWTNRCYYYEQKTVYLYKDNIHKIIHLEKKDETKALFSSEISMEMDIISNYPDFIINTRHALFSFYRKGIQKQYNIEGTTEIVLLDKSIANLLEKLASITISINFRKNQLEFVFYSEKSFEEEIMEFIFQLMEEMIRKVEIGI